MIICVQDLLGNNFSDMCYDTVSNYVTLISSILLNYLPHQYFCGTNVHDTSEDTTIWLALEKRWCPFVHRKSSLTSWNRVNMYVSLFPYKS
jgi:hypothetical protein